MKKNKPQKNYNGRDFLKVKLIQGATKAATHTDKRKQADKDACREFDDTYDPSYDELMWED